MKFTEITYGKSVNQITGESWEKVSAKVSIGENEDADFVFITAKMKVEGWLTPTKQMFDYYDLKSGEVKQSPIPVSATITIINKEEERKKELLEDINNSTTLEELKQYETPSMKYDLVQEYINKKKALS